MQNVNHFLYYFYLTFPKYTEKKVLLYKTLPYMKFSREDVYAFMKFSRKDEDTKFGKFVEQEDIRTIQRVLRKY